MNISTKKLKLIVSQMIKEVEEELKTCDMHTPEVATSLRQKIARTLQQLTNTSLQIEKLEQIAGSDELLSSSNDKEIIAEFIKRAKGLV